MAITELVVQSQLLPPRRRRGILCRLRLDDRLAAVLEYPVTVVHVGTGYGKSTALATLTDMVDHLASYSIIEPDRDPLLFLAHLVCAFERQEPAWCQPAIQALEESGGRVTTGALAPFPNALTRGMNDEAVLALDDYQLHSERSTVNPRPM
jgi:ATP/maltotriose-dependent transcriptional regulator MalT